MTANRATSPTNLETRTDNPSVALPDRAQPSNRVPAVASCTACGEGTSVSIPQILTDAARYLERHGWIQDAFYTSTAQLNPAASVVGAIGMVCYGRPSAAPSFMPVDHPGFAGFVAAMRHLDLWSDVIHGTESWDYNDAPGRTAAQVIHALRQAAATNRDDLLHGTADTAVPPTGQPSAWRRRLTAPGGPLRRLFHTNR